MRVLLVLIIAGMGLGSSASGITAQEATPAAPAEVGRTSVRYFLPFDPDGLNADLAVVGEAAGFCSEGSIANIGRPDAWFCQETETNAIHDPCYENPFGPIDEPQTLACVASPFAGEVVLFTATEPLTRQKDRPAEVDAAQAVPEAPADEAMTDSGEDAATAAEAIDPLSLPWAVELSNGERCGLLTGATAAVAGMRLNYGCDGGGWLVGDLDRGSLMWTANYYDEQSLGTRLVEVATVWT